MNYNNIRNVLKETRQFSLIGIVTGFILGIPFVFMSISHNIAEIQNGIHGFISFVLSWVFIFLLFGQTDTEFILWKYLLYGIHLGLSSSLGYLLISHIIYILL